MKRVLFLTQGDQQTASSRLRVYQYLPLLEKAGVEATISPAVLTNEFENSFVQKDIPSQIRRFFRTFSRRIHDLHSIREYDFVYIQKPVFPAPLFNLELRAAHEGRAIFDFDDAVYTHKPGGSWLTNAWPQHPRIISICKKAFRVAVGNEELASFAKKAGADPVILPTVVDAQAYASHSKIHRRAHKIPVIGWVGSTSTLPDLMQILPSLVDLHSKTPFVVRVIGGGPSPVPVRFPVEWKPWNLKTEIGDIAHLDLGLAPLADTPWNRGKCGLKILQYWAAGVPVVASPVGVHRTMIQDGVNGLLANTQLEWREKLLSIIKTPSLRNKLIEGGLKTVREQYDLQVMGPRFLSLFDDPRKSRCKKENIPAETPIPVEKAKSK